MMWYHTYRWSGFNSRSRMGSDISVFSPAFLIAVSIHAPAWGATSDRGRDTLAPCFNSRSRMGSDINSHRRRRQFLAFQFTLPHGERHDTYPIHPTPDKVSIHAPAWGATWHLGQEFSGLPFQFTLPHGERHDRRF